LSLVTEVQIEMDSALDFHLLVVNDKANAAVLVKLVLKGVCVEHSKVGLNVSGIFSEVLLELCVVILGSCKVDVNLDDFIGDVLPLVESLFLVVAELLANVFS